MSVKYTVLKGLFRLFHVQNMMAQPYDKLIRKFKTETAVPNIPSLSDPALDIETITVMESPVLALRHKAGSKGALVYLVGGGMLKYPKPGQAREMVALANHSGRDVYLPYYPLRPRYTLLDVYAMLYRLYKELLKTYEAENILFLGGSSGGFHALGLMSFIHAKGEYLPLPGKLYLSSPGTLYLTEEEKERAAALDKTDVIMSRKALDCIFEGMTGGADVPDYLKYLQLGNYTGLDDAYLCFGGEELFRAAAESIRDRLEACGVHITLEIGEGLYHSYSAMPLVKEAQPGYERMLAYIKLS